MAKTAPPPAPPAAAGAPKKSPRKRLLLAVVLSLVLAAGAGGGGGWWWSQRPAATADRATVDEQRATKPPVFVTLEPFTVNLQEENGDHYLQLQVVYRVTDDKATELLRVYMPVLRDRVLTLLASKRPSELNVPEGKTKLVGELLAAARESLPGENPDRGVQQALLGAFVIQ